MDGIGQIADSISTELQHRLPRQRKRGKLALLVATMLDVRSANLMDLAAGLPLEADRTGPLGNAQRALAVDYPSSPLVLSAEIMEPFAREVLEQAVTEGQPVVLILPSSPIGIRC